MHIDGASESRAGIDQLADVMTGRQPGRGMAGIALEVESLPYSSRGRRRG